jgi:hypothetical protein
MAPTPRLHVDPPNLTPPGFGLLTVAQTPDASDPRWQSEGIEWPTECIDLDALGFTRDACLPGTVDPGDPTPAGPDKTEGHPRGIGDARTAPAFTLWASHICSPGGRSLQQDLARVGRVLTAGEAYTVGAVVETGGGDSSLAPFSLAATATTPAGTTVAATAEALVAMLEHAAADAFPGMTATLHLRRDVATLALGQGVVTRNGAQLSTVLGSPVAADVGFAGVEPTAGAALDNALVWGYATGPVVVYRTAAWAPGDDEAATMVRATNDRVVIAERTYSVGWECGAIAIPLDLSYTTVPEEP